MELTVGSLIKILLGLAVVAAVGYGLYLLFTNNINGVFGDMDVGFGGNSKAFLALLNA